MLLGAACAVDDADPGEDAVQQDIGGGCAEWACGTNSPQIANFGFWEMASPTVEGQLGLANNAGLQIAGFIKQTGMTSSFYMPRVIGGKLVGIPGSTNVPPFTTALRGAALVNGYFLIWTPSGWFKLFVKGTSEVASWAQPPGTPPGAPSVFLETYLLDWTNLQGEVFRNVCSKPGQRDDTGMNGPLSFHTLLFEGDRINAGKKEIRGIDTQWFNFGCAASTLAKMALTGHTEAARVAHTFNTSVSERQAMLKLLTADYCGLGIPWTVAGQRLNWADDRGTMKMVAQVATPQRPVFLEARWNADGAVCLNKPRVDVSWSALGEATFGLTPKVYTQVAAACGAKMPPVCASSSLGTDGHHLVTATEPNAPPP
ncbi:MAG: hypothetical protein H7138_25960 [Myxococcales bacterium]|nr:hypothetical protein [Myxococcales bacterium]